MVKKVLVINKYHFISGGAERYFFSVMDAFRCRGIEAIPFSVNYGKTVSTPYQSYFIEPIVKDGNTKIFYQKPSWREKISLAKQAIYNETAKKAVHRMIEDLNPDIAYLLNINNHISPSVIDACSELSVPVVMRMSDFNLTCVSNMYYRDGHPCHDCKHGLHHAVLHRCVHGSISKSLIGVTAIQLHRKWRIYDKVARFVTPTQFMKQELMDLGFESERIHHIKTFAESQNILSPDENFPYILFVGRFAPYKGIDTALRAFMRADFPGVHLKLIGDENDHDAKRVKAIVTDNFKDRIHFEPFERDKSKLLSLVQKSLFVLVPSENYENLPNTILEAFSCARPVIGTRLGSMPEIIEEGKYGLLYNLGDIEQFAAQMKWMVEHPAEREQMGLNAYQAIQKEYSEENHMSQLISLFESIANSTADSMPAISLT